MAVRPSRVESVQIDPVVAFKVANCFNNERAPDEEKMVRDISNKLQIWATFNLFNKVLILGN
jgi:hypothetical protein